VVDDLIVAPERSLSYAIIGAGRFLGRRCHPGTQRDHETSVVVG
jgi:hypothetical protein